MSRKNRKLRDSVQHGFSIIELLIIVVIIGILLSFVIWQYTNVAARNRDTARKNDIKVLQEKLSEYFALNAHYPVKLSQVKDLPPDACRDPKGKGDCIHPDYTYKAFNNQTAPVRSDAKTDCDNKSDNTACYSYILYTNSMEDSANPYMVSGN